MSIDIRDKDFKNIAKNIKPDSKKRVALRGIQIQEDIIYHMYTNTSGQIVLDPQVTIPASEAWLYKNPGALAAVKQGLLEAAQGLATKINFDDL